MEPKAASRGFIPRLDPRLVAVLELIEAEKHADLGTDHAGLPIRLIQTGRVKHCVAIDLNAAPLQVAQQNVRRAGLESSISLRLGNGLEPLERGEVESLSMTGLGAGTIAQVLAKGKAAEKLPQRLVVQCNDSPLPLRRFALEAGYWLENEKLIDGYWPYPILVLVKAEAETADPAYERLPMAAALRFGPLLLKQKHPLLRRVLADAYARYEPVAREGRNAQTELEAVAEALEWLEWSVV